MPRTEPTEDATFPVYRVRAVCWKCGKKGETQALTHYAKDAVIKTLCSRCVKSWETGVRQLGQPKPLGVIRTGTKPDKPDHNPREYKPHWTDKW